MQDTGGCGTVPTEPTAAEHKTEDMVVDFSRSGPALPSTSGVLGRLDKLVRWVGHWSEITGAERRTLDKLVSMMDNDSHTPV